MLYIISEASRSGKTLLAKQLARDLHISYLSLDWIMMGFNDGIPEFGVHHLLFPDDIAKRLWKFYKAMFESMIYTKTDCVIEGESLLPSLLFELREKYPNDIRSCFLGFTNVDVDLKRKEIKKFSLLDNDWLVDKPEDYIIEHIQNMVKHSKMIKEQCIKILSSSISMCLIVSKMF